MMLATVAGAADNRPCKVFAVLSYHDEYAWQHELKRGIQTGLGKHCEPVFFALDSLKNPQSVQERARQAFALVEDIRPDVVIAADDPAQVHFTIPYLKQRTAPPVIFCGVNANLSDYGYPTPHITGVLERYHVTQTLAFLKKTVPTVRTVSFVVGSHNVSGQAVIAQIREELKHAPLRIATFKTPASVEDAIEAVESAAEKSDAIYLEHFEGMKDAKGTPHSQEDVMKKLTRRIPPMPIVCGNDYTVESGCLLAVMKTGFEQGYLATKMVLRIMQGSTVEQIPVTQNREGIKIINLNALKRLGITPPVDALRGVKLMREQ